MTETRKWVAPYVSAALAEDALASVAYWTSTIPEGWEPVPGGKVETEEVHDHLYALDAARLSGLVRSVGDGSTERPVGPVHRQETA